MSKVGDMATIRLSNVQKKTSDELPRRQKKNGSSMTKGPASATSQTSPAFQGANFNKYGYCLKHNSMQLVKPQKNDAGRVVYQELRQSCPSCLSDKNKSKRSTSLGGGKVTAGHRAHGARTSSTTARSRSKSRERGNNGQEPTHTSSRARARSKARDSKPRREYDTPFDGKGRCHYHVNVQLASKKMTGGWKVLQAACPKCMDDGDDRSVRSNASRKSHRSGTNGGGDAQGQYDQNGCCVLHPHIQVAKKKLLGGFKVVRDCPNCGGGDVGADDYSVKSGKSARSAASRKSGRPAKAAPRGKPGTATSSGRYGSLPFDAEGYCCRHPNVQLAKKKALGGFKILVGVCPECRLDDGGGGRKTPSRRQSRGTGRVFDDGGSEASSKSKKSGLSSTGSSTSKKKRIRVRNLRTEDEDGKHGQYTGFVNHDHRPHGDGVMKYKDGTRYDGVWNEGSKVHGKTTRKKV